MKKVTDQELKDIQDHRQSFLDITFAVGELSLSKGVLERQLEKVIHDIKEQQEKFAKFQDSERVLFEKLQQKYGTGNINLDTGEITE